MRRGCTNRMGRRRVKGIPKRRRVCLGIASLTSPDWHGMVTKPFLARPLVQGLARVSITRRSIAGYVRLRGFFLNGEERDCTLPYPCI